jgi:hypothetical protein
MYASYGFMFKLFLYSWSILFNECDKNGHNMYSHLSKVFGNVKKSLCNQPKPYFFKKLLWSHFWINFNIFYTKTFGIVCILFVYLLIMFIWVVFICT